MKASKQHLDADRLDLGICHHSRCMDNMPVYTLLENFNARTSKCLLHDYTCYGPQKEVPIRKHTLQRKGAVRHHILASIHSNLLSTVRLSDNM